MIDAPVGLALAAGMLAAVNPCGFALLPAYLALLVTGDAPGRLVAVGRALSATAFMTAGFVAVFGVFGLVVAPVAGQVQSRLPWVTIAIGIVLVLLGGWLAAGRELPGLRLPRPGGRAVTRHPASLAVFGVGYAIASLSCTIGPFLAIVASTLRAGSVLSGTALFVAYAVGMGVTVGLAALAVALAQGAFVTRVRRAGPALARGGGVLMILAGAYVAYYGWWEARVLAGGDTTDPVVGAALAVQRRLTQTLEQAGFAAVAIAFVVIGAVAVGSLVLARRSRVRTPEGR